MECISNATMIYILITHRTNYHQKFKSIDGLIMSVILDSNKPHSDLLKDVVQVL